MVAATETKSVNLTKIAKKISLQSQGIRKKAQEKKTVNIPVSKLVKKVPELEILPPDAIAVQIAYSEEKDRFYANTLTLFKEDDTFIITDAALNPLKELDIEYIGYQLGYSGSQHIKIGSQHLRIDIRMSRKFYDSDRDGETGEGTPPLEMVRLLPGDNPVPMKALEEEETYTVISQIGTSEYDSPIYKVKSEEGEEFAIISNASLESLLVGKELPFDFQIDGKEKTGRGISVKVSAADSASFDDFDL